MAFWTSDAQDLRDLRRLTDVQLIHKLNDAVSAREASVAALPMSRRDRHSALGIARSPAVAFLIVAAVQIRDALHGFWLGASMAASPRLVAWAAASEARLNGVHEDIRILALLRRWSGG